ncbi:MAG: DNA polymerase III subunit gamma/tau [Candidatus Eisenbacteria bacterium]|nr:DNA polymerase III subunit gamma/tau [Candidatus Eisenbacteria bacterium]
MAHRALTLKYRPQVFADLIGQDHVSTVLARALESGRVAHAFLFTGARGVGKTTSARILAKALNCEKRAAGVHPGADPCNACTSCVEITSGVSLDVVEIDGASNRGIDDVQSLREKVRFAPTRGRFRIVIIDEVHQLSKDAFAALLKTLEEPPAHLVFIFATTDPQKLPDTIRSRTQRFDFARVALRKVADRLLEIQRREAADPEGVKFSLTDGAALLIAHKGEGSMRDSVGALDQVVSAGEPEVTEELVRRVLGIPDHEGFFRLGEAITKGDPRATLQELHRAFEKGMDPRDLAEGLADHFRGVLLMKVDGEHGGDLLAASREDLDRLRAQGADWSETDLLRLLRIAAECQWPMRDSPQPIVHLEAAVLQMATLEPAESLATLLARLEALEKRLGGSPEAGPAPARAGSGPQTPSATGPSGARGVTPPATRPPARAGEAARGASAPPAAAPPGARSAAPPAGRAPARGSDAEPRASAAGPSAPAAAARERWSPPAGPASAPAAPEAIATTSAPGEDAIELDALTESRWKLTLTAVNGRKRMLGAFLEESRLVGLAGGSLVLAMDDLHRAVVDVAEHRAIVCEELANAFGEPLQLRCAPLAAGSAPRRTTLADVQPNIDRAIARFDGEMIDRSGRGDRSE